MVTAVLGSRWNKPQEPYAVGEKEQDGRLDQRHTTVGKEAEQDIGPREGRHAQQLKGQEPYDGFGHESPGRRRGPVSLSIGETVG